MHFSDKRLQKSSRRKLIVESQSQQTVNSGAKIMFITSAANSLGLTLRTLNAEPCAMVPTIQFYQRSEVTLNRESRVLPRDYREAQAAAGDRPIKITLPGPLTIMDTTADCYYNDDVKLARALADALNKEVLALANAGCKYIQIDEPVFARKPDAALSFGVETLERVFHGVPNDVIRTAHMCCGYPDRLDNPEYPKANHKVYHDLVEALDGKIDALSIEDCHCHNDMSLFEKFKKTTAIVGFIEIAVSRVETVDEIVKRMYEVLKVIPADRLIAAPDCGLGFLGRSLTEKKLTVLCEAANQI